MKLCILGGGGVRTVIFINGLLKRCRKLNITDVVLYDTDREKQEIIGKLCRYVVRRESGNVNVTWAQTSEEAISGADYIVTTLRVGGDHGRVLDERLALRHGVIGQETTGVGGFSMAVRTIPVLLRYMQQISRLAPEAPVFNFTNPSGLVTQALHSAGYGQVIGICDAPSSMKFRVAHYLNVPEDDVYMEFFGLNHLSWIRQVRLRGNDITEQLMQDDAFFDSVQEMEPFDRTVIRQTGLLPNEYLYYYYHREKALKHMQNASRLRGEVIEEVNRQMFAELREMDLDRESEAALQVFLYGMQVRENSYMTVESGHSIRPLLEKGSLPIPEGMGYAGVMLDCIEGMQSEQGRDLVLSVRNGDSLPFLKPDDVVEMTCNVSKRGIVPVRQTDVPEMCETYIRLIKRYERLTVQALQEHSPKLAVDALALHPLVNSWSLAGELLDELRATWGESFAF